MQNLSNNGILSFLLLFYFVLMYILSIAFFPPMRQGRRQRQSVSKSHGHSKTEQLLNEIDVAVVDKRENRKQDLEKLSVSTKECIDWQKEILLLVSQRRDGATACPSEVARRVRPHDWRDYMQVVRDVAYGLAQRGLVEITQKGIVIDPSIPARGPIRIRKYAPRDGGDSSR